MATETNNLKLNKPDKTDFYNIDLVNANMDKIDEAITGKADKKDIPTSLPANGGNADTVDGKHASDFLEKNTITNFPNWDLNELSNMDTGFYSIQPSGAANPTKNAPLDAWGTCFHIKHSSTFHQIALYSLGTNTKTYRRSYTGLVWTFWSDWDNALTLGGKKAKDFIDKGFLTAHTTDFRSYLQNLPTDDFPSYSTIIVRCYDCTNMPYGSGDFICYVTTVSDSTTRDYITILALDVRSNNAYRCARRNGTWYDWIKTADSGNAETLQGLPVYTSFVNRGIRASWGGTGDLTAGTSSLDTGTIYFVYE